MNVVLGFVGLSRSEYDVFSIMITNTRSRRGTPGPPEAPADSPRPAPNSAAEQATTATVRSPPRAINDHTLPGVPINPRITLSSLTPTTISLLVLVPGSNGPHRA